jgi:hypothetical protein
MRFLADENFNGPMLRGLRERIPELDVVRVQDTEIYEAPDPEVLEWAARENRVLLTHDYRTMPKHAYERVREGLPMPGIIQIHEGAPIGPAIDELQLLIEAGRPDDFDNLVTYVQTG